MQLLGTPFARVASRLGLLRALLLKLNILDINGLALGLFALLHHIQVERILILGGAFDVSEEALFFEIAFYFAEVL